MTEQAFFQLSTPTTIILITAFYVGTFIATTLIGRKRESVDAFMISNHRLGFGMSSACMTATWIWAASFYASAASGYQYGISGPIHYGLWGALMILFIYPFGQRFRQLAPNGHTLGEVMHARHGTSSQLSLALSNVLGSGISLMTNLTAAGVVVSIMSPLSFMHGVLAAAIGVLLFSVWSGFRAAIIADFIQVSGIILISVIIIPTVLIQIGGPGVLVDNFSQLTPEQRDPFSTTAILEQGAPFFVAVLAYAIGNQTISQRLFAVRPDRIKASFLTATVGYGSVVVGLGMLGLMAAIIGMEPTGGDVNNIVPQMASSFLPPVMIVMFFILVLASLSSTTTSDLAAMSAIVMTDIYAKNLARGKPNPRRMLMIGRVTMIVFSTLGVMLASLQLNILELVVFLGAVWGAIVFPVIVSCYWQRVTNGAFTAAVVGALVLFPLARFELLPLDGPIGVLYEIAAAVGGGVVLGLMSFGFFGRRAGITVGSVAGVVLVPLLVGFLREYPVLLGSLTVYGVSAIICVAVSLIRRADFDFALINERVRNFQDDDTPAGAAHEPDAAEDEKAVQATDTQL